MKKWRFGPCPAAVPEPDGGNNSFDSTRKILDNDRAKALSGHHYALFFKYYLYLLAVAARFLGRENSMSLHGERISAIRVFNIMEEGAAAIEKMVNSAIDEIHQQRIKIIDVQLNGDNLVLILGDKEPEP